MQQHFKFRTEALNDVRIGSLRFLRVWPAPEQFAQHFRQRHQTVYHGRVGGKVWCIAVSQFHHAVQYAHSQRFAATRANAAQPLGFTWLQHHAAVAVAVKMILAFFGEKFQRAVKSLRRLRQRGTHGIKIQWRIKEIGFAPQLGRRVAIRVGN